MTRALVIIAALTFALPRANAQDSAEQEATRLRDLAVAKWQRGDYLQALDNFERAYAVLPTPNLRFNIARVQADLGRDLDALENFEHFLSEAKNPPAEAVGVAKAKVTVLSERIARIKIHCTVADADLFVDGRAVGKSPLEEPIRVTAGPHQVTARRAGFEPGIAFVNPRPAEVIDANVHPQKPGVTKPLVKRWWFWTTIGVAAVAAATSIGLGVHYGKQYPSTIANVSPQANP